MARAIIRDAGGWIDGHCATPNPVSAMVKHSGLTSRTFARRFLLATGRRPIEHVHAVRIERARDLLEHADDTVDAIGYRVGYEDPTFFRRLFKRTTGLAPAAYRRKYAQILMPG
jgi:transcriptional regulator GlxA family with amidase domain